MDAVDIKTDEVAESMTINVTPTNVSARALLMNIG
jgi:hypothetical protein